MSGIDCACIAKLVSEQVELKTSQKGTLWAAFTAVVGAGDDVTYLRVSVFGDVARKLTGSIVRGSKVYLEGTLRLNEYTSREGEKRTGLQVAATKCEPIAVGRSKPPRSQRNGPRQDEQPASNGQTAAMRDWQRPPAGAAVDTEIPFSPEVR